MVADGPRAVYVEFLMKWTTGVMSCHYDFGGIGGYPVLEDLVDAPGGGYASLTILVELEYTDDHIATVGLDVGYEFDFVFDGAPVGVVLKVERRAAEWADLATAVDRYGEEREHDTVDVGAVAAPDFALFEIPACGWEEGLAVFDLGWGERRELGSKGKDGALEVVAWFHDLKIEEV